MIFDGGSNLDPLWNDDYESAGDWPDPYDTEVELNLVHDAERDLRQIDWAFIVFWCGYAAAVGSAIAWAVWKWF